MLKRMLFVAAITGLMAGAALPLHSTSAEAASGCFKAAKAKFPGAGYHKVRHEYRVACRAHWKAYKTAQRAAKKAA